MTYAAHFRQLLPLASLLLGTTLTIPGYATDNGSMTPLPIPTPPPSPHSTLLFFTTEGTAHATPTQLTLHFSAHSNSPSPAEAQQKLNQIMKRAMNLNNRQSNVSSHEGNYTVYQDDNQHDSKNWNVQQSLTLSGSDTTSLFNLAEQLQHQGLILESMDWSLDPATHNKLEEQARAEALRKIRLQAEENAKILGLRIINIDYVHIGNGTFPQAPMKPRPFMLMATHTNAPTPPQSTAEEQSVHVNITAQIHLAPE